MKINRNRFIALFLMVMGIALFIINAIDVFLGYKITHGKGFQILGLFLILLGVLSWMKSGRIV